MRDKMQLPNTNYQSIIPQSILILTSFIGLSFYPSRAITATVDLTPNSATVLTPGVKDAVDLTPNSATVLTPGLQDAEVQVIQVQLKALGYYSGSLDGKYGSSTQNALAQFQQSQGLKRADGIADWATRQHLKSVLSEKIKCNTAAITEAKNPEIQHQKDNFIWWRLISFGVVGTLGILFYLAQRLSESKPSIESTNSEQLLLNPSSQKSPRFFLNPAPTIPFPGSTELLTSQQSTVISALSIADELMKDLHSNDATKRRKAIWHLGQQGDSRAMKPLVDLMVSADSRQHSLILSALAEIGIRTLKPMNRALAISIQDENPQVRQNAIRDLSRIYDMMGQMSQMLRHALEDEDPEVQATAQYALNHINRVRVLPKLDEYLEDSRPEPQT